MTSNNRQASLDTVLGFIEDGTAELGDIVMAENQFDDVRELRKITDSVGKVNDKLDDIRIYLRAACRLAGKDA